MGHPAIKLEPEWIDILINRMQTDLMLIKLQSDNIEVMLNEAQHNRNIRGSKFTRANEVDEQKVVDGVKKARGSDCGRAWANSETS